VLEKREVEEKDGEKKIEIKRKERMERKKDDK